MTEKPADIQGRVGIRIRNLRREVRVSQEALALDAELDRTYINSVENGHRNISIVNLEKIASAFGISVQEFFSCELFSNERGTTNE